MIEIFIKHWIFEKCINIIFNNFYSNFANIIRQDIVKVPPWILDIRNDGMRFSNETSFNIYNNKSMNKLLSFFNANCIYIRSDYYIETKKLKTLEYFACNSLDAVTEASINIMDAYLSILPHLEK